MKFSHPFWNGGAPAVPTRWKASDCVTASSVFFGGSLTKVGFFKDALGIVRLKGTLAGTGNGTTAFTLPEGYRPAAGLLPPAVGSNGVDVIAARLLIRQDDQLQPVCAGFVACDVGLDGLSFRVP
ncbi:MAG TPA: hypothetical protein VFU09_14330 [Candidatus Udaeobacter sp.]|nr:hypothetical protein [Candidatus Udaeobacter sp.]